MTDSFVTVPELVKYMSEIGLDAAQTDAAQDVLNALQRQLERHLKRPISITQYTETIWPDENGMFWPKNTPLISVQAPTTVNGQTGSWVPDGNAIAASDSYALYAFGWDSPVTFTYTAGIDPTDAADIKAAILRAAAREMAVRHDDVLDVNDLTARNTQPVDKKDPGFSDAELAQFDTLRRRTVA